MSEIEYFKESVNVGGNTFWLKRVKNLDDLVDKISDELFNEDERLPYWAELWPSALALSEYILECPEIFKNKDILELGCGLGLTTMALASAQPKSLLATDYEEPALECTDYNFALNKMEKFPQLRLMDWRNPELDRKYDVIVASDVVYEERFFQPLIDLFKTGLDQKGKVVLAEPNRKIAQTFFGKLALTGFDFTSIIKNIIQAGKSIQVCIYDIHY